MTILTVNAAGFGLGDVNRFKGWIRDYRVRQLVLRDNVGLANELVDEFPWLTLTFRYPWPPWHAQADDAIQAGSVDDYVTFIQGLGLHFTPDHRMRIYVGNELATNETVASWLTTCVKAFAEERIPGDFGNWAVGNPPQETCDWVNIFPEYLKALSQHNDLMRSGHHEYFVTHPFQANFPYHVGRTTFLDEGFDELREKYPGDYQNPIRKIITECGWDLPAWILRGIPAHDYNMHLAFATDVVWTPAGIEMAAVFQVGANDHSLDDKWQPYDIEVTSLPVTIFSRKDTAMPDYVPALADPVFPSGAVVRAENTITGKYVDVIKPSSGKPRTILAVLDKAAWLPPKAGPDGSVSDKDDPNLLWIPVHITEIPADGYVREDVIKLIALDQPPAPPPVDWEARARELQAKLDLKAQQLQTQTEMYNAFLSEVEQIRAGTRALLVQVASSVDALFSAILDPEELQVSGENSFEDEEPLRGRLISQEEHDAWFGEDRIDEGEEGMLS